MDLEFEKSIVNMAILKLVEGSGGTVTDKEQTLIELLQQLYTMLEEKSIQQAV